MNVGPTAEGLIPEPSVERLEETGSWLRTNGEAIYKTEKFEKNYSQGENIRFTKKKGENTVYAISLIKPETIFLINNIIPNDDSEIYLLGQEESLEWHYDKNTGLKINIPVDILNTWKSDTYAWAFKITGKEI